MTVISQVNFFFLSFCSFHLVYKILVKQRLQISTPRYQKKVDLREKLLQKKGYTSAQIRPEGKKSYTSYLTPVQPAKFVKDPVTGALKPLQQDQNGTGAKKVPLTRTIQNKARDIHGKQSYQHNRADQFKGPKNISQTKPGIKSQGYNPQKNYTTNRQGNTADQGYRPQGNRGMQGKGYNLQTSRGMQGQGYNPIRNTEAQSGYMPPSMSGQYAGYQASPFIQDIPASAVDNVAQRFSSEVVSMMSKPVHVPQQTLARHDIWNRPTGAASWLDQVPEMVPGPTSAFYRQPSNYNESGTTSQIGFFRDYNK